MIKAKKNQKQIQMFFQRYFMLSVDTIYVISIENNRSSNALICNTVF